MPKLGLPAGSSRLPKPLAALLRLGLALTGGALAGLSLPHFDFWPAIFVSVALIHLAFRGLKFWLGFAVGIPAGIAFYASQSIWMSAYLGPEPWLALAVLEGLIFGLGAGLAAATWRWLSGHRNRLNRWYYLLTPAWLSLIWVAREWVACHFPYGGYQWSRLGQAVVGASQGNPSGATFSLANLAYWGGISLVSLATAAFAIGAVMASERFTWRGALRALSLALVLGTVAALTPAVWALTAKTEPTLSVLAVQGNANAGLFANPVPGSILSKHLAATYRFLNQHPKAKVDLVVWPENASDVSPLSNPIANIELRGVVAKTGKPLLVGAVTERDGKIYNSSLLVEPGASQIKLYDKTRPVPFGEYVPDRPFWRALAPNLIDLISRGYEFGKRPGIFDTAGTRIGALICFEIGIDEVSHNLVTSGAKLIVSQANNADFGHTDEAAQQEALVRLQAIATGRYVVHASTVATTEIVAPDGTVLTGTEPFTAAAALGIVGLSGGLTPAMRFFGWVDYLALAAAALAVLILIDLQILRLISGKTQGRILESLEVNREATLNTLVIMPTYNEAQNIRNIAGHLLSTVPDVKLLIVDDNSPDGTGKIADEMAAENPRVNVLHRTEKNGLGPAYLAGFAWGFNNGFEYLVEMDADGSHRAEDLIKMLAIAPQNDLVIGSRWVKGGKVVNWPLSRQIISRTGNAYARIMLGAGIRDITAGFRVFRASFLQSLDLASVASAGYSFQVEMAWRCYKAKARISEVPITFVERAVGYSKMSKKIVFEALWRVTKWGFERF